MTSTTVLEPTSGAHGGFDPAIPKSQQLVEVRSLTRVWGKGESAQVAVDNVDLSIASGELLAIVGPSGSGKSTLGSLLAGLDRPTAGSILMDEVRLDGMKEDALAGWRAENVGIVFQNFHLVPTLTAAENVSLSLRFGPRVPNRKRLVRTALDSVGLGEKARRLPSQLSGGEQQRVGIARAIVHRPRLIVADEPTGSLDTAAGRVVFDLISGLRDRGTTIVFITHDPALAAQADRTVTMVDGRIESITESAR
jgi:putative ABC transport system ATP-binding protein